VIDPNETVSDSARRKDITKSVKLIVICRKLAVGDMSK
jgi:hypothetical protein